MKQYNFYISNPQLKKIRKIAKRKEIKVSELIRRALRIYIKRELERNGRRWGCRGGEIAKEASNA